MSPVRHQKPMELALGTAQQGHRGANPLVGAILVHGEQVLAVGHHRGAGSPHAERVALSSFAEARARGAHDGVDPAEAVLYTTLEPCRHHGRQPPCTEAILEAGIGTVVYGAPDPTPRAGGGAQVLSAAGLEVIAGVLDEQCRALNHRWLRAQEQGRPFVTVHLAQTLDGRIAAADGSSRWITSAASREHTHTIRERIDAILVGTETALIDDPRLTARTSDGALAARQPLRCVMGLREIPEQALLRDGEPEGHGWRRLATRDPGEALRWLSASEHRGHPVRHVLVEGGARVMAAFFAADLVDEVFVYQAPLILGAGPSSVGDLGITTLRQAPRFVLDSAESGPVRLFGTDVCTHLSPEPYPAGASGTSLTDTPDRSS
ncbi:bifunctional diaminohydroxyphosphoribosylaminopyrimidine deaminase/5-amino-6-(5-phosphoribosylamino)uracil reductase RibD [Nesterenkonia aerolata]|uniref:Riboflavin biosynthesis protein RibD n=1 Tax=Nesterenkonia aerolata TaxID=3074079 RepID=A0ABU2DPQ4_9MICC|nr:bifunctional diaminohydroxyphosphoribosylaminopyrimidine deaminase/5-amino-6-(5-phosphoribosylamino)uracil reductase RibD [Nesterenkonia sp. LY-0111]MDR8018497.1 bifunctional diaminohydroxyphosphoribosylaminopyrimidine deaminase/5-amino-6-(5-phosphoribosylamino)uracil reductase RibD [Nesterenkonia sp. LY-0111]